MLGFPKGVPGSSKLASERRGQYKRIGYFGHSYRATGDANLRSLLDFWTLFGLDNPDAYDRVDESVEEEEEKYFITLI